MHLYVFFRSGSNPTTKMPPKPSKMRVLIGVKEHIDL
jgi:hypothetical protein